VQIDGHLNEQAWEQAPLFDAFVETFPRDGAPIPPEFRTVVRALYDDQFLYVAIRAHDPQPELIARQLSRRDTLPSSDYIEVSIDPTRQGTTGYSFILNAAGVQRDLLLYGDVSATESWDAVWDGEVNVDSEGWTAELAIPLRVLRFPQKREQAWGINVRRVIPRTHQTFDSTYIPRNANPQNPGGLVVSRFGALVDLVELEPQRNLEVAPYVAARLTSRPQYSDPTRPTPTLIDPSLDLGLDVSSALTSNLNLAVAINPDFGQVEADQIIQNVSTAEQFFPEKRPFFNQGLDLFEPVGAEYGPPQRLFYSRRIGLDAPILVAVKLTGSLREGTEIGLLDAVVMGAGNPSLTRAAYAGEDLTAYEARPDRRWQYHLVQPLHFGPNNALPAEPLVARNNFAAVIRQKLSATSAVGVGVTSAVPLEPRCGPEDFENREIYEAVDCTAAGANAAAIDGIFRTPDGQWGALGQFTVSQEVGGPEEGRLLPDGTVIKPGDLGYGFNLRAGKLGGEPFRFDVTATYLSPTLDLNALGFQNLSNYQWYGSTVGYVKPNGFGPFRSASVSYTLDAFNWSAEGRFIRRGNNHWVNASLQLPSYDTLVVDAGWVQPEYDLREIPGANIAFERASDVFLAIGLRTDSHRPLSGFLGLVGIYLLPGGPVGGFPAWQINSELTWHPTPSLETFLAVQASRKVLGARYLTNDETQGGVFGLQEPSFLSVTLRQQFVVTPKLTVQGYAQLFSGAVAYPVFFGATLDERDRVSMADLVPIAYSGNANEHFSALNLNLVLRWEYRRGSTLYAVYTRSQQELPAKDGVVSTSMLPVGLENGAVSQTAMVKWSYWWDL